MRVLFTTQPGVSHLRSLVTVAEAARRLGHTVAVAAAEPFHADIEPYGLGVLAAGHDWRPEMEARREEQLRRIKEGPEPPRTGWAPTW